MFIASSISWIVTPNILYSFGCFHHLFIHFHHPSYDLQWSCVCLHLPEGDIVVGICCNRYWDWQLIVQGWKVYDVCIPRMSIVETSRYGSRSIHCKQSHFLPSPVPPRYCCTTSDIHLPNHRCYPCGWCEDDPIDHWWDWVFWVPHPVSTWGCMPWWWWNTEDNHAFHSRCTFSLTHWTYQSHQSSSSMVPLSPRSFLQKDVPIFSFHYHPAWLASLSQRHSWNAPTTRDDNVHTLVCQRGPDNGRLPFDDNLEAKCPPPSRLHFGRRLVMANLPWRRKREGSSMRLTSFARILVLAAVRCQGQPSFYESSGVGTAGCHDRHELDGPNDAFCAQKSATRVRAKRVNLILQE